MDKKSLQLLYEYVNKYFYYIEYPNGLDKYFWKDADGKKQLMLVMNKAEITSCINIIDTDMNRFYGCQLTEMQQEVLDAIFPLAQRVKNELKEQLDYQVQQEDEEKQRELSEYLEIVDEEPRSKPVRKRPKVSDITRVPIRVLLPLWMVKRLKAEGNIGPVLEKYLLKSGISEQRQGSTKPARSEKQSVYPPDTDKVADAWKKDIKNILNSSINAILGFSHLALSPYKWPEETMNNYLTSIEKTAQRMKSEIDKF